MGGRNISLGPSIHMAVSYSPAPPAAAGGADNVRALQLLGGVLVQNVVLRRTNEGHDFADQLFINLQLNQRDVEVFRDGNEILLFKIEVFVRRAKVLAFPRRWSSKNHAFMLTSSKKKLTRYFRRFITDEAAFVSR